MLDLFNREVVGWSVKPRMTADILTDALSMHGSGASRVRALFSTTTGQLVCESCHARQDRAVRYDDVDERKGNCWDNAPMESFFNSLKNERVHGTGYETPAQAEADLFEYIAVFYNRRRRHSTLGYCSPTQFLDDWLAKQAAQLETAA